MARLLPKMSFVALYSATALTAVAACGDDDPPFDPLPAATSTGGGGVGGVGGATSTTTTGGGGTGGEGAGGEGAAGGGGSGPTECMGPDTGADTCDGEDLVLSNGAHFVLCGDLESASDTYQDYYCPEASASGDRVYNLTINDVGTLKVQVRREFGSSLNPTMFARWGGECTDQGEFGSLGCWNFFNTHEEFADEYDPAFFGPNLHLFIDGGLDANNMSTTGGYELEISFTAPACGDGVLNFSTNEQCDDGNTVSGDGCSSACIIETTSLFDQCPGEPVNILGAPAQVLLSANTIGNSDGYSPNKTGTCGSVGVGGHDRVYRVTPNTTGTLTATVGLGADCATNVCESEGGFAPGCWDYVLWVRGPSEGAPYAECGLESEQLGCSDGSVLGPEAISFPVEAQKSYFIFVDGYADYSSGPFNLCIEVN